MMVQSYKKILTLQAYTLSNLIPWCQHIDAGTIGTSYFIIAYSPNRFLMPIAILGNVVISIMPFSILSLSG